ncbi:MAG: enoyl-CoA hydratase-related protein [Candidatus Thermoplasmatota archaeon]|nr:enoyl-CoA hydratase-related protein [Candidatus Thermoplasmatota archaeon]
MAEGVKTLKLERFDSVARITIDRADRLNALGADEMRGLHRVMQDVAQDPEIRAVVLTGSGKAFSAGGDVREMSEWLAKGTLPRLFHELVDEQEGVIKEIVEMAKPVIAAIPGVAAGGGMSITLACDWRIASTEASLVPAFPSLGGVPDGGLTFFLPHYLGIGGAQEVLYGKGKVTAQRAHELSLFHEVVPLENLQSRALEKAQEMARGPIRAFTSMKRLLAEAFHNSLQRQMELERRGMVEAAWGEELSEGIRAFNEKRPPAFHRPRAPAERERLNNLK